MHQNEIRKQHEHEQHRLLRPGGCGHGRLANELHKLGASGLRTSQCFLLRQEMHSLACRCALATNAVRALGQGHVA